MFVLGHYIVPFFLDEISVVVIIVCRMWSIFFTFICGNMDFGTSVLVFGWFRKLNGVLMNLEGISSSVEAMMRTNFSNLFPTFNWCSFFSRLNGSCVVIFLMTSCYLVAFWCWCFNLFLELMRKLVVVQWSYCEYYWYWTRNGWSHEESCKARFGADSWGEEPLVCWL